MDAAKELKDFENFLRRFISNVMQRQYGESWPKKIGLTAERVARWEERMAEETKKRRSTVADTRLLSYADIYDLRSILEKQWTLVFVQFLGKFRPIEDKLKELESLRNADAHGRTLMPSEKALISAISGQLRATFGRYNSELLTNDDPYPNMISVQDSLGSLIEFKEELRLHIRPTNKTLDVGQRVEFVAYAVDPQNSALEFRFKTLHQTVDSGWQASNEWIYEFTDADVSDMCDVSVRVRSGRVHHRLASNQPAEGYDDQMTLRYRVHSVSPMC